MVANIVAADEGELEEDETTIVADEMEEDVETTITEAGPWVLTITTGGYGKRVPVGQFRLQNRAGKGTIATKFKSHSKNDRLAGLHVVHEEDGVDAGDVSRNYYSSSRQCHFPAISQCHGSPGAALGQR